MKDLFSSTYEKRAMSNMEELLDHADNSLRDGFSTYKFDTTFAVERYKTTISTIEIYFQHVVINGLTGDSSRAFYYQAEASYCLAILYYQENAFVEASSFFMKATLGAINGLKFTNDMHDRREIYFKIMKNALIYMRAIFKKKEEVLDTKKYLNAYLPLLKEELMLPSSGKECEEFKRILKKFVNFLSPAAMRLTAFWNTSLSAETGAQNNKGSVESQVYTGSNGMVPATL